jgi:hypothetical protein
MHCERASHAHVKKFAELRERDRLNLTTFHFAGGHMRLVSSFVVCFLMSSLTQSSAGDFRSSSSPAVDSPADRAAIVKTIGRFFAAEAGADIAAASDVLLPDGVLLNQQYPDQTPKTLHHLGNAEWLKRIPQWTHRYKETAATPTILVHGPIAVAWFSFKFETDGKFSHCGVNIADLVKSGDDWKIANLTWTIEKYNCPE